MCSLLGLNDNSHFQSKLCHTEKVSLLGNTTRVSHQGFLLHCNLNTVLIQRQYRTCVMGTE